MLARAIALGQPEVAVGASGLLAKCSGEAAVAIDVAVVPGELEAEGAVRVTAASADVEAGLGPRAVSAIKGPPTATR
jgi:hypothetical protein